MWYRGEKSDGRASQLQSELSPHSCTAASAGSYRCRDRESKGIHKERSLPLWQRRH
jgi:hypothetical protein